MDAEKISVDNSRGSSSQTEAIDTVRTKAEQPIKEASSNAGSDRDGESIDYVSGVRYGAISLITAFMFFLPTIDTTIAATSLVAITNDLGDFEAASWVLTSYLVGYVAVIVIFAKFSDIFGRKLLTIGCILTLTVFSAGCAASQTLTQLIVLRAFQGVGGGGCFALGAILLIESNPPNKYADAVAKNGLAVIIALVLGPILGGIMSERSTWRWIFWFNLPIGAFVTVLALLGIPNGFPYQGRPERRNGSSSSRRVWARVDVPGTFLILLATLSFTACFQESGSRFAWNSAYVICLLVLSVSLWLVLMIWERHVTLANGIRQPVLPWRLFTHRASMGLLGGCILVGAPIVVTNFQLPQRFKLINGTSNFDAGIRIIPFSGASAVGTVVSGKLVGKLKVPSIYIILLGAVLQVIGYAFLGTLRASTTIEKRMYGFQVIAGLGCAFSYSNLMMLVAFVVEKRDAAVTLGAMNQFRGMGSAIGLAIVTSVFNYHVGSQLSQLGISDPLTTVVTQNRKSLPPASQENIRSILSEGYNQQMLTLCAFGAAQVPVALLLWKRKQLVAV